MQLLVAINWKTFFLFALLLPKMYAEKLSISAVFFLSNKKKEKGKVKK